VNCKKNKTSRDRWSDEQNPMTKRAKRLPSIMTIQTNRKKLLAVMTASLIAAPLAVQAQNPRLYDDDYLAPGAEPLEPPQDLEPSRDLDFYDETADDFYEDDEDDLYETDDSELYEDDFGYDYGADGFGYDYGYTPYRAGYGYDYGYNYGYPPYSYGYGYGYTPPTYYGYGPNNAAYQNYGFGYGNVFTGGFGYNRGWYGWGW